MQTSPEFFFYPIHDGLHFSAFPSKPRKKFNEDKVPLPRWFISENSNSG
jgi:hypothetical protein